MIKLEHVVLPSPEQMEFVIEGMRNPMNSWDRSDSGKVIEPENHIGWDGELGYSIGPDDLQLMQKLSNGGPVHSKYMRMMPVMLRITAPLYWWKEFDTYKVGTVANSCSTMHKITEKEFTLEDFSVEHLFKCSDKELRDITVLRCFQIPADVIETTIASLNYYRNAYLRVDKDLKSPDISLDRRKELVELQKQYWWQLIQLLPSSYNQTRNVMLDYEVLKNIYIWRKDHKLDEWREFCKWIETLPYSELITGGNE